MTRLSLYILKLLERVCAYTVFLPVCPGESTWPVSRIHRRVVLGNEETPLLTAHQPVSWSSPGPTSCGLHRVSQDGVDEVDGPVYWFILGCSVLAAQLSHAGRSSLR